MKLSLALLAYTLMLVAQFRNGPQIYWPYVPEDVGISNFGHSAAANWAATNFIASGNRTLSSVEVAISSVTGTPVSNDLRVALYSDSGAKPGTEIEGITSSSAPVSGWNTVSGFTASVTPWTQYWIVVRNMNGTPASNFFTSQRRQQGASGFGVMANSIAGATGGWISATTTDSGTNWTKGGSGLMMIVNWADGTKEGFAMRGSASSCQVYASRECGLHFQTGELAARAVGIVAVVSENGTITGSLRYRLYEGSGALGRTLVATSSLAIQTAQLSASLHQVILPFSETVTLKAKTWYTLAASETTQSDTSSNRINIAAYDIKSDAWQLSSADWQSSPKLSLSTDGGSIWSDTSDTYPHMALVLDPARPFVIPSGGLMVTQ